MQEMSNSTGTEFKKVQAKYNSVIADILAAIKQPYRLLWQDILLLSLHNRSMPLSLRGNFVIIYHEITKPVLVISM